MVSRVMATVKTDWVRRRDMFFHISINMVGYFSYCVLLAWVIKLMRTDERANFAHAHILHIFRSNCGIGFP